MFLSRMELDPSRRATMQALSSPNKLHGAIEQSFAGPRKRRLWRLDQLQNHLYLLLLSEDEPDLTKVAQQFGFPQRSPAWESRAYEPLLDKIVNGTTWHFRLVANPVKSCKSMPGGTARGTIHAHITTAYQAEWLLQRCQKYGFALDPAQFMVVGSQWRRFYKGAQRQSRVTILAVSYEGLLTVTDADRFCQTLREGLGRGKAFGLGMLTVMRS